MIFASTHPVSAHPRDDLEPKTRSGRPGVFGIGTGRPAVSRKLFAAFLSVLKRGIEVSSGLVQENRSWEVCARRTPPFKFDRDPVLAGSAPLLTDGLEVRGHEREKPESPKDDPGNRTGGRSRIHRPALTRSGRRELPPQPALFICASRE